MGMDVVGRNPSSPSGKYFQIRGAKTATAITGLPAGA
jgi:hypothetical protein